MISLCAFADEAGSLLAEQIEALHRNTIGMTELRSIDGVNVSDFTPAYARRVSQTLRDEDIRVWSIGSPIGKINVHTDFPKYLEKVKNVCELANIFDCDRIRMFSFFDAYEEEERVISYLREMVDVARSFRVHLCHENEKGVFGDTVERVKRLMEQVPGMRFVYDPANFRQAGEDPQVSLDQILPHCDYYHIKDYIAETEELVPAGMGDCDIPGLIRRISSPKVLTLEPHLAIFQGYSDIDHTEMKNKLHFDTNAQAFDYAVTSLRGLLMEAGYTEANGGFIKA